MSFTLPPVFKLNSSHGLQHGTYLVSGSLADQLLNRINVNRTSDKLLAYDNYGNVCGRIDKNFTSNGSFTLTHKTSGMFTSSVSDSFTLILDAGNVSASVLIDDVSTDASVDGLTTQTYSYTYYPRL